MFVDSPSAIFNLDGLRGQGIEHLVVNRGNAGLGTVSICLICVALVTTMVSTHALVSSQVLSKGHLGGHACCRMLVAWRAGGTFSG